MTPIQKEWLFGLRSNKDQYELTTIRQILEKLGQPQRHPRIVHIAGTNGKGSTLVTLEKLLIESGFSVGSTISPHLLSFNERFRINGLAASEQLLDVAFHRVREVCGYNEALLIDERRLPSIQPSFFEFSIAMAFVIFQGQNLDFLLLETGLGGRLDATNIITNPLVNIITQIDYDHQTFLGESLKEITMEKMGIIKKGAKVFLARQKESVSKQVMDYCEKENIELYLAPKHFCHKIREDETRYIFDLNGERNEAAFSLDIKQIGLLGDHQKENIQTALAVYFKMIPIENRLSHTRIQEVIRDLSWPCRMEYRESGGLLLDGAHNASGMKSLMDYLQRKHKNDKILVAICWMDDKEIFNQCGGFDLRGMDFLPVTTRLVRSASPLKMVTDLKSYGLSRLQPLRLDDFISSLSQKGYEDYDLVVVTGSLFFLGEFLTSWNIKENHANNLISTVARAQPLKLDSI